MKHLIKKISEEYDYSSEILKELEIIIDAWAGMGMSEAEIKEQLRDYEIYL